MSEPKIKAQEPKNQSNQTELLMSFIKLLGDPEKIKQLTILMNSGFTNLETGTNYENNANKIKLIELNKNSNSTSSNGKHKRKLKNLTIEDEIKYIENLNKIYNNYEVLDFHLRLLSKLKLKDPIFELSENKENQEKFKCILTIKSDYDLESKGYGRTKKTAKKLAAEQMILKLLNHPNHSYKTKKFIDNFINAIANVENTQEEGEIINIDNNNLIVKNQNLEKSNKIEKISEINNPNLNQISKIHLSIENLPKLKKKEEIINLEDIKSKYEINEITQINFEIFCLKWERHVLLEKEIIYLDKLLNLINEKLNFIDNIEIHSVGSFSCNTLRKNCQQVDILVGYNNYDNLELIDKCVEILWTIDDLNFDNFEILKSKLKNNIYDLENKNFICIYSKEKRVLFNIYFMNNNYNNNLNSILEHKKWYDEIKNNFSIEDLISLKLLKSWRRCHNLNFIKSEILEFFISKIIGKISICEKILTIFDFILSDNLENKNFYLKEYQSKFYNNLTKEQISIFRESARKGIENLKEGIFVGLFVDNI